MPPRHIVGSTNSVKEPACKDCLFNFGIKPFRQITLVMGLLVLGACSAPLNQATDKSTGFLNELPEGVAMIAAPYQNLQEVILRPEDGCYWYRHVGPVETMMLPLRTVAGRPICTQATIKPQTTG